MIYSHDNWYEKQGQASRAKRITSKMLLAAAQELARLAPKESLLPNILDRKVHDIVAEAVRDNRHKQAKTIQKEL